MDRSESKSNSFLDLSAELAEMSFSSPIKVPTRKRRSDLSSLLADVLSSLFIFILSL